MKDKKMARLVDLLARWVRARKTGRIVVFFNQGGVRRVEKFEADDLDE